MSGPTSTKAVLPSTLSRIILTGFMGAGKTTVGGLLAARLGWTFLDSDRFIESRAGMTIAEIFAQRGEPAFRELEAAAIREASHAAGLVLALGGGAIERPDTRALFATMEDTLVVFLDAPLETLILRCAGHEGGPVRPVLADRARLEQRWRNRQPWYRQAHLTIPTAGLAPEAVAGQILQQIRPQADLTRAGAPA
jgi:shikimate kinase